MAKTGTTESKVSARIGAGALLIAALFVGSAFVWLLPRIEETLLQERKAAMKAEAEVAWCVLNHYDALAQQGAMTRAQAMTAAVAVVRDLRYGPAMKDYFWINDLQPVMIMHPYTPALEGQDLSGFRDPSGVALFVECVKICRERGDGYVTYSWQYLDDATRVVPKLSYVRLFRPWNWMVGTGIHLEDVKRDVMRWRLGIGGACLALVLLAGGIAWGMGREADRSVRQAAGDTGGRAARELSLRAFILLIVVPALILLTAVWCAVFYRELRPVIMSGFDRKLIAVSSTVGSFIRGEDHARIASESNEASTVYLRYARPMKQVMKQADLTYLYTQILAPEEPNCTYILDATEGPDHSSVGSADELPVADYLGGERVQAYGIVYLGQPQFSEKWGTIRSSFAPIYNPDDTVTAMAGADVNISVINDKLRGALFTVALVGILALVVAGMVSWGVARQLTRPIEVLNDGALEVAAGAYGRQIRVDNPVELRALADGVNGVSNVLQATLKELTQANDMMEARKRRYDLTVALDKTDQNTLSLMDASHAFGWFNAKAELKTSSGWTRRDNGLIFWLAGPVREPLDAVKLRNDIAVAAGCLLKTFGDDADTLAGELDLLFPDTVRCFFLHAGGRRNAMQYLPRVPVKAALLENGHVVETLTWATPGMLTLAARQRLVVSDADACVTRDFLEPGDLAPAAVFSRLQVLVEAADPSRQILTGIVGG